jgi:hypothetical protein
MVRLTSRAFTAETDDRDPTSFWTLPMRTPLDSSMARARSLVPRSSFNWAKRSKFVHDGAPGPHISKEVEARRKFAFTKTGPPAVRPFGLYRLPADRIRIG